MGSAFDNPYGGSSTVSLIKSFQGRINPSDFLLSLKTFNVAEGKTKKEKVSLVHFLRRNGKRKEETIKIDNIREAVKSYIYDSQQQKGVAEMEQLFESEIGEF